MASKDVRYLYGESGQMLSRRREDEFGGIRCSGRARVDYRGRELCMQHAKEKALREVMSKPAEAS